MINSCASDESTGKQYCYTHNQEYELPFFETPDQTL